MLDSLELPENISQMADEIWEDYLDCLPNIKNQTRPRLKENYSRRCGTRLGPRDPKEFEEMIKAADARLEIFKRRSIVAEMLGKPVHEITYQEPALAELERSLGLLNGESQYK